MLAYAKWLFLFSWASLAALQQLHRPDGPGDGRQGRNLLDWIGLGTGPETDPYLAKTNSQCLNGDLAACFQSRALGSLDEFFDQPMYSLTENARVLRLPESHLRSLVHERYEYSEAPRSDESEWDQLVKFVMRKVEKFMKSSAFELDFNNEVTEQGRYSPRFVDEIVDEIDVIEDKKDNLFKRKQLKKLLIPMLLILKVFKLKLLLFLPLILGLASFKKLLGFLAIIIPGAIAYFKFCKPNFGNNYYSNTPQYSLAGIAYQPHFREPEPNFVEPQHYPAYTHTGSGVHFRDENSAQHLAYNGWDQYSRNNGKDIQAEVETSSKKSILPDS